MNRRRRGVGILAIAGVSIVSNLAWFAIARKFPTSPVGQLNARLLARKGSSSS